jgi:catechol 2,3-dioxygenase-like lactoylglutathione lyase family enzyme
MIKDIHHFSFTVSDMDRSLNFYRGILNGHVLSDVVIQESNDHSVTRISGAKLRIAFLSVHGSLIELIQYLSPIGEPLRTRTCDTGSAHIAFVVDNMDATYHDFQDRGVHFKSEPIITGFDSGTIVKCVYFLDPDGITLELVEIG